MKKTTFFFLSCFSLLFSNNEERFIFSPAYRDTKTENHPFFEGTLLYWQCGEKGLEVGHASPSREAGYEIKFDLPYQLGFKILGGINLDYDKWNFSISYLDIGYKRNVYSNAENIIPYWLKDYSSQTILWALAKWKLSLQLGDIAIAKPFYASKKIAMRPAFGMRIYGIRQNYRAAYGLYETTTTTIPSFNSSHSFAFGPQASFGMDYIFGRYFKAVGNLLFSLCYQKFNVKNEIYNPSAPLTLGANMKNRYSAVTPNFECSLGFASFFEAKKDSIFIKGNISYTFETFFNQNRLRYEKDSLDLFTSSSLKNLFLHGLSASIGAEF